MENEKLDNPTDEQTELLRRNLEVSEDILKKTDYIKEYIKWQKIWGVVKILVVVVPIVLGVIYLPPMIRNYLSQFALYK